MDANVCEAPPALRERESPGIQVAGFHMHIPMNRDYSTTLMSAHRYNEATGHGYSKQSGLSSGVSAPYTDCLSKLSNEV